MSSHTFYILIYFYILLEVSDISVSYDVYGPEARGADDSDVRIVIKRVIDLMWKLINMTRSH